MAAGPTTTRKTFPPQLIVTVEKPPNDSAYLAINENLEQLDYNLNGQKVAIYQLVEVRTLSVKAELK